MPFVNIAILATNDGLTHFRNVTFEGLSNEIYYDAADCPLRVC